MSNRNWDYLDPEDAKTELVELANRLEDEEDWKEELISLLEELLDDSPCHYDHHGKCQAHSLHEKPCPHEKGKQMLARINPAGR